MFKFNGKIYKLENSLIVCAAVYNAHRMTEKQLFVAFKVEGDRLYYKGVLFGIESSL